MWRYCRFLILKGDIYNTTPTWEAQGLSWEKGRRTVRARGPWGQWWDSDFHTQYLWTFNSVVSYTSRPHRLIFLIGQGKDLKGPTNTARATGSWWLWREEGSESAFFRDKTLDELTMLTLSTLHPCTCKQHCLNTHMHTHIYRRWRRHESLIFMREHRKN